MLAAPNPVTEYAARLPDRVWLAIAVLVLGLIAAYLVGVINRRLLTRAGVPEAISSASRASLSGWSSS